MSAYKRFKTQMTDLNVLIAALEEVKPNWRDQMLVDPAGKLHPYGYQGDDRTQVTGTYHSPEAVIIIPGTGSELRGRGKNVVGGASNDISVSRGADGKFVIDISQNESHQYNDAFKQEVAANYGLADKLSKVVSSVGAGNLKIGNKQTINHPTQGQVLGIPCAVKISKKELAGMSMM